MGRQNPMKQDDAFKYIPPELCFEIFSYLDIESFRAIRRVSKRIKILADASRNLSFNCDLTDTTIATIVHSTESFSCVKVHNFGGEKNKIVSSTRGTGRVFGCAQAIHLIGSNINAVEIGKMMQYAVGSVNELIFQHCNSTVLTSVFDLQKPFESLRRLTICHNYFPSRQETQMLENLGSETVSLQLPHLECFKISYELVNIAYGFLSPNDVFANYLAVAQLIHRYKETLRTVEISRNEMLLAPFLFLFFSDVRLSRYQRDQMQKCVEGFNETKLDFLTIVTLLKEGTYPWTLETALIRQQRILKDINLDKKFCILNENHGATELLLNALPANRHFLTSIKIGLRCSGNETIDLHMFSQCPGLKTLWLVFSCRTRMNTGIMNKVNFTNVDQLPCTITSLHFKDNPEDRLFIHQESILSLEQIQWIIANLKQLESLWLQLLTEEQIENDVEGEADNEDEEENDNDDEDDFWEELEIPELQNIFHQQIENIERLEVQQNMNVPTFRELISMPKLSDMKFDMLIAGEHRPILAVEFGPRYYVPLQSISPVDIQEYLEVCEQDQRIMFNVNEVEAFPFRFTELSITRGY